MNPTALVILVLALALLVVAFKGTQDNFMSAILGRPWNSASHLGPTSAGSAGSGILSGGMGSGHWSCPCGNASCCQFVYGGTT